MAKTMDMRLGRRTDFDTLLEAEVGAATQNQETVAHMMAAAKRRLLALRVELLPTQLAMLLDPSKRKAECATRRSGKTYYNRHEAAEKVLDNPWVNKRKAQPVVQYIAPTQKKALDLFWTPFKILCERIGLEGHFDDQNLRAQFPNGVLVRAAGVDTQDALDKYLGDAYVHVIVDEAQALGPKVEDLIMSKLSMAMADYEGTTVLTGTPGPVNVGYFYEVSNGGNSMWSVQPCWTFMDNIHLPANTRTEQWIVENVGPLDSARVRRECYGEWVSDASTFVYKYTDSRNAWDGPLPQGHEWRYLLGVDLGFEDPTAFVIGAYATTHPWLFVVHSESHQHLLPSQIEDRLTQLHEQWKFTRIVVDQGGSMAKSNIVEWNMRGSFGLIAAEKTKKYTFIEHMNSDFHRGRIKVFKGLSVVKFWKQLPWESVDAEAQAVRHDTTPREHSGFPNHECDAALYMYRESRHYRSKDPEPPPLPGTIDYWRKNQLHAKNKALQAAVRNTQRSGFRYGRIKN